MYQAETGNSKDQEKAPTHVLQAEKVKEIRRENEPQLPLSSTGIKSSNLHSSIKHLNYQRAYTFIL
jgi:hypothetical protein